MYIIVVTNVADSMGSVVLSDTLGIRLARCSTRKEILAEIDRILSRCKLPDSKDALILLKPNLNSDMIALTGNTTDLRIITAIVSSLKKRRYDNIVVADGTSTGFLNTNIDVLSRLGIHKLGEQLGFTVVDLNHAEYKEVRVGHEKVRIARICYECDFFVNVPKLKTHSETGLSVCIKNLMGCVVGRDKQKIHNDLGTNIFELMQSIQPSINIVDGLIGMEGMGPSRGIPKRLDFVISGEDPLVVDFFCARLVNFEPGEVSYLRKAVEKGLVNENVLEQLDEFASRNMTSFRKPNPGIVFRIVNHPKTRKLFVRVRYIQGFYQLLSSPRLSNLLYSVGVRQDMLLKEDAEVKKLRVDNVLCFDNCVCVDLCPVEINVSTELNTTDRCIKCMYCFFACPKNAITMEGTLGHLKYQVTFYRDSVKKHFLLSRE